MPMSESHSKPVYGLPPVSITRWESVSLSVPKSGKLDLTVGLKNNTNSDQDFLAWLDVNLPNGKPVVRNPFSKPISIHLASYQTRFSLFKTII